MSTNLHFFFFNDPSTTYIYTLSLHDALPILEPPLRGRTPRDHREGAGRPRRGRDRPPGGIARLGDRKSTRLNSSHVSISYAVFCLKKKNCAESIDSFCSSVIQNFFCFCLYAF